MTPRYPDDDLNILYIDETLANEWLFDEWDEPDVLEGENEMEHGDDI